MTTFNETVLSTILARTIMLPGTQTNFLGLCTPVFCANYNGIRANEVHIIKPNAPVNAEDETTKEEIESELITVPLNKRFKMTLSIPTEVDLKSNFDLIEVVRSFFAGQFRVKASNAIEDYITTQATLVPNFCNKIEGAADIAQAITDSVYNYHINGTANEARVYKFSNGAPVVYSTNVNQFNAEVAFTTQGEYENDVRDFMTYYQTIDSRSPGQVYATKPTFIFEQSEYKLLGEKMLNKVYSDKYLEKYDIGVTGQNQDVTGRKYMSIFGTNDCIAFCYTEPRIQIVRDNKQFGDLVRCEIYYGFEVVNNKNLTIAYTQS